MATTHIEREDKFDVPSSFRMPAKLAGAAADTVHLESTYYDTPDHDLLQQRVTLRRRTGDTDEGWHLKVPHGDARLEVRLPLGGRSQQVPAGLAELLPGLTLGAELSPVAVLRTDRRRYLVRADEHVLAEIADDTVHAAVTGETAQVSQWREVEVELVDGDERVLERIGKRLRAAGAEPAASGSKIARALEQRPSAQTDADDPRDLIRAFVRTQVATAALGDVAVRRGQVPTADLIGSVERLRSMVRVFAGLLDAEPTRELDAELAWLQTELHTVSDADAQRVRMAELVASLPPELVLGPVAADSDIDLGGELARRLTILAETLNSDRYLALLRTLRSWTTHPPVFSGARTKDLTRLVRTARHQAKERLAKAGGDDDALYRARLSVARLRHATELTALTAGGGVRKTLKRQRRVERLLDEHHVSVLMSGQLRRFGAAGARSGRNGFTFGLLYAREEQHRRELVDAIDELSL